MTIRITEISLKSRQESDQVKLRSVELMFEIFTNSLGKWHFTVLILTLITCIVLIII